MLSFHIQNQEKNTNERNKYYWPESQANSSCPPSHIFISINREMIFNLVIAILVKISIISSRVFVWIFAHDICNLLTNGSG